MQAINQVCWEILSPTDPILASVRDLYQSTQKVEEQIPWEWIENSLARKSSWQPGRWSPHLLVTADVTDTGVGPVHGFINGGHVPDYGGYISYLGVDPSARKRGLGTLLFESIFASFREDSRNWKATLPFVVWESCRPASEAPPSEWNLWTARMKTFDRVGAFWVEGLDFLSPNFMAEEEEPIVLQLFIKPMDLAVNDFTPERLKEVALGLQRRVYRLDENDPLVTGTLPPGCSPRLRSPLMANRVGVNAYG